MQPPAYKDPRIPIARHIDWHKTYAKEVEFTKPEPDNYNRAVCADRRLECNFIKDHVFYHDFSLDRSEKWWTVYYVPDHKIKQFDDWIKQQQFDLLWVSARTAKINDRKPLLYARKNSDMTLNERLYTMGYYKKLENKYFSDNNKMLLERLGPARAALNDLSKGS